MVGTRFKKTFKNAARWMDSKPCQHCSTVVHFERPTDSTRVMCLCGEWVDIEPSPAHHEVDLHVPEPKKPRPVKREPDYSYFEYPKGH